jgi:hypothetical protein
MIGRVLQALVIMLVFGLLSWFIYEESLAQRADELERPDAPNNGANGHSSAGYSA